MPDLWLPLLEAPDADFLIGWDTMASLQLFRIRAVSIPHKLLSSRFPYHTHRRLALVSHPVYLGYTVG